MTVKEIFEALAAPFHADQVRSRPTKFGKNLSYITARTARQRLNEALGPENWSCRIEPSERWVKCILTVVLPDGRQVTREALGGYPDMPNEEDKVKGGDCLPLDARALTRDGWRRYDELAIGQEILAYDMASGLCRWTPLLHVSLYETPLDVVRMASKSFNMICTPNHRWVVDRRDKGILLKETKDLDTRDRLVTASPAEGGDHQLTPREALILGWIATDGSVGYYKRKERKAGSVAFRCVINQSKEPHRSAIRDLLGSDATEVLTAAGTRTFPGRDEPSTTLERSTFNLKSDFARNLLAKAQIANWFDLIPLVTRLSVESREALFRAMLAGDGHHACSGQVLFGKKRKPGVMEAFEILATLQGVSLGTRRMSTTGGLTVRTLRRLDHTWAKSLDISPSDPVPVWCPTTAFGTWVVEWKDTVTITSNSDAFKRACSLFGIGEYLYGDEPGHDDGHIRKAEYVPAPETTYRPKKEDVGGWFDKNRLQPRPDNEPTQRRIESGWPKSGPAFYAWMMGIKDQYGWPSLQKEIEENFVNHQSYKYPYRFKEWDATMVETVAQWVASQCATTENYKGEFKDHLGVGK